MVIVHMGREDEIKMYFAIFVRGNFSDIVDNLVPITLVSRVFSGVFVTFARVHKGKVTVAFD